MAAAAPLLLAAPAAEKATEEAAKFARDVIAQMFDAIRTPVVQGDRTVVKATRSGKTVTDHQSYAVPAWFIVGGLFTAAVGAWILGIGLHAADTNETRPDGTPVKRLILWDRPRFSPDFKLF